MAESGRFAFVEEDEILKIIGNLEPFPKNTKKQTSWSVSVFKGKLSYHESEIKTNFLLCCSLSVKAHRNRSMK